MTSEDTILTSTLRGLENAHHINRWIYDTIRPFCRGHILEIGSGLGNISQLFVNDGTTITLSDISDAYVNELRTRFAGTNHCGIVKLDIASTELEANNSIYDTIIAINVIEHIENDEAVIRNMHRLLVSGGRIIILVPAYQLLFNKLDSGLGHFRRYTAARIVNTVQAHGFSVQRAFYFNFIGILGWSFSGILQQNGKIPDWQIKLYNVLVPLFRVIDRITFRAAGLSVICVGVKR
jgi:SAM-dependent methyltransferase